MGSANNSYSSDTPDIHGSIDPMDLAGRTAAILSVVEIGLGSFLHSLRIPFTGHTLSLNQGFFLSRASLKVRNIKFSRIMGSQISLIQATLKSLSPAGKKLTPMLAIATQGALFSFGTLLFGVNALGIIMGMIFLSLWAFVQPVLIYYLLYGKNIIHIADYFFEKFIRVTNFSYQDLWTVLAVIVLVKLILSVLISIIALKLPEKNVKILEEKLINLNKKRKRMELLEPQMNVSLTKKAKLALKDLFNPLFVLSLIISMVFFYLVDTPKSEMIWFLIRPIAAGFLIFFLIRAVPFGKFYTWMEARHLFSRQTRIFKSAITTLKDI